MHKPFDVSSLFTNAKKLPGLSAKERKASRVLIADSDNGVRHTMRQSLLSLGFGEVHDVADHRAALQRLEEEPYNYVIFEAKTARMPAKDFLDAVLELDSDTVAIPSSYEPTVDDVFDLLIVGAKGFIVKPFTTEALDDSIIMATNGEPISDSVRHARNRNEALASLVLAGLDGVAILMKQSRQFETAKREIQSKKLVLRRAVEIGKTFARGGPMGLREAIIAVAIERSEAPRGRVGRFHERSKRWKEVQSKEESGKTKGKTPRGEKRSPARSEPRRARRS